MKTPVEISDKINHLIELLDYWREELRRTQSYDDNGYRPYCQNNTQEIKGRISELKWTLEE